MSDQLQNKYRWYCDTCNRDYTKSNKNLHLKSAKHAIMTLENRWYCDTCNRDYTKSNKNLHLKGTKHARSLENNNQTPIASNDQIPKPSNQTTQKAQLQRTIRNSTKFFEVEVVVRARGA